MKMLGQESFCPHLFKNPALVLLQLAATPKIFCFFPVFWSALSFRLSLKVWSPSLWRTFTPLTQVLLMSTAAPFLLQSADD